jgi:hypothetical protein
MKLDNRTKDIVMAIVLGILIGAAVYLVQRKFTREGYEGEEGEEGGEDDVAEKEAEAAAAVAMADAAIESLIAEGEELEEEIIVESEDVGEEEIDEFDEELAAAQESSELELPDEEEMEEEIEDVVVEAAIEEAEKPAIDIAAMAQDAIMAEVAKALN